MKRGFILIEALLALVAMGFLMIIITGMTSALVKFPKIEFVSQLDVFKLQFDQLISQATNLTMSDQLCFNLDIRNFCIKIEDNRIVKIPGYEILLNDVSKTEVELSNNEIFIYGVYIQKPFILRFKLK